MARGLQNYPNITIPDTEYPNGRIKDNPGNNTGTPINEFTNGDLQQFFAKLIRAAGITPNGLPDNEYNGLQYFEALRKAALPWISYMFNLSQGGTFDPSPFQYVVNTAPGIGMTWLRTGTGVYTGTRIGAFPVTKTFMIISGSNNGILQIDRTDNDTITITTFDLSGTPSDGIMTNSFVEIRVLY